MGVGRAGRTVLILAGLIIVFAGIKSASSFLVPALLAMFVATVATPLVEWLAARKVPAVLSVVITILAAAAGLAGLGALLASSLTEASRKLPHYQRIVTSNIQELAFAARSHGFQIAAEDIADLRGVARDLATTLLGEVANITSNFVLLLVLVVFMLLEAGRLRTKLLHVLGGVAPLERFHRAATDFNKYLAVKTATSASTGLLVGACTWMLDVDLPVLWGLLAFLLNFIPAIGSIIAAIPAVLIALIDNGVGNALAVSTGYLLINMTIGNFLEPRILGRALGLSPLVVLLSVVFWGWLLGPAGALLSSLLTMIVKLLCMYSDDAQWVATMLAPASELEPHAEDEMNIGDALR